MVTVNKNTARRLNGNGNGKSVDLSATDVTGQRRIELSGYPADATVRELVSHLVDRMNLSRLDANGAPVAWHARLARQSRHLHASEVVGEAIQSGDEVALHPNVDAGGN